MILKEPCVITSRLLPGVKVGESFVSIEYSDRGGDDGRTRYRYYLDFPDGTSHTDDALQSGCDGGDLQAGLRSLLSFLSAAGESYAYGRRNGCKGENAELFPEHVTEWAYQHGDELSMLSCELEEQENLIEEMNP